ncbi:MAG: DUF1018 domain-containing protein [Victivallales bacterium]|nr:DUF1018 domain-containing protein [Victivallales bacterium]
MWSYRRKGKGCSQVALFHVYARACQMSDEERRELLFEETGFRTSKAPKLTQGDFDRVMIRLERRLVWLVEEGVTTVEELAAKRIGSLDYWAKRNPAGAANTRQCKAMWESWLVLRELLPAECRSEGWLLGFVEKCSGASDLWTASAVEAGRILDGLRQRIRQERKAAEVVAG